jgi:hypothetical protein
MAASARTDHRPPAPASSGDGAGPPTTPGAIPRRWGWIAAGIHAVVFAPVIISALFRPDRVHPSLWVWHAARIPETFHQPWRPVQVHFGWAGTSRLLDAVLPTSDPRVAGAIVSMAAAAGFGAALWFIFSRTDDGRPLLTPAWAAAASLLVALLEAPAAVQGWMAIARPDDAFIPLYYPFVPTTLASMGLNVIAVWGAARILDGRASPRLRRWLPLAVVAAAIAKPNVVPMLGATAPLVALALGARRWDGRFGEIVRTVTVPAAAITFVQWVIIEYLSSPRLQGTMELNPFFEVRELGGFGWQFWLVATIPVAATVLIGRRLVADRAVLVSLASFALGLGLSLAFARAGSTPDKGSVGGDILQLAGTTLTMVVIFVLRRLVVLHRAGKLARATAIFLALLLVPYLAAGLDTWRCHSGLARCYPASVAGIWPQPPLDDP